MRRGVQFIQQDWQQSALRQVGHHCGAQGSASLAVLVKMVDFTKGLSQDAFTVPKVPPLLKRRGLSKDPLLHPANLTEDFHRPHIDEVRLGVLRDFGSLLNHNVVDTEAREQ